MTNMFYFSLFLILSFVNFHQCDTNTNIVENTHFQDTNDLYTWIKKQNQTREMVRIDLYYESLCPYCIDLYTRELAPLMLKMQSYIKLHTYPFGNARVIEKDGKTEFLCQHGPRECFGNGLQACVIQYLPHKSQYVPFNACLMSQGSNIEAADQCGQQLGVDPQAIKSCANSDEAVNLLKHYAEETAKVNGRNYVPYTLINGQVMNSDDRLKDAVCAAFKKPPRGCQRIYRFATRLGSYVRI